jgi:vacuolar-type H+-ATPase subunit I/STV1
MTRLYFGGMPQPDIAKRVGADQSTISIYASRFRHRAAEVGLLTAGKEFGVFNEVDALRSLSVELTKASLTVQEAKKGLEIVKTFAKFGIGPDQHTALVKACKAVGDPGFVEAAVKLSKLEAENNLSYEDVMARFENASSKLASTEKGLDEAQAKLKSLTTSQAQRQEELASVEGYLVQLKNEAKTQEAKLNQELEVKMKHLRVKQAEAEELSRLKTQLGKQGLDIPTLIKLAQEFGYGNAKGKRG